MYRLIITLSILIFATIVNYTFSKPQAELSRRLLKEFPSTIGDWKSAHENKIDDQSMAVLLVDDYIMRTYINNKGEAIGLYIGYFQVQKEGKQVHSPRQCLPGGGWNIVTQREYLLKLDDQNHREVQINLNLMRRGSTKVLYLWWYHGRGRIYANEYLNKLYLIWDAITKRRTDGALVRINMTVNADMEQVLEREIEFIDLIMPLMDQYIPG